MSRPLNLLFITADQWRGECLSRLGHKTVRTPHLDAFAEEAVQFRRHFANTAPCAPSRATLHTGLYLHNHRVCTNGTPLEHRRTNWALELRKLGYDPQLIGYTDTTPDPRLLPPDDPDLKTYEGLLRGLTPLARWGTHPGPWADHLRSKGYSLPENLAMLVLQRPDGPDYEDGAAVPKPFAIKAEDNDTAYAIDRSIDFIDRERRQPWALHLSLLRPHPPWIASEPYNSLYDPMEVEGFLRCETPQEEAAQHPWLAFQLSRKLYLASDNERKLRRMKAVYFGLMSEVDAHLGRLFAHMKRIGEWDETLVVFTSDHGEQMGDHWLIGKCGYFDQSYAIPLIVRDPRPAADPARGRIVDAFTEHVDILPTMLEALNAPVPPECDGHSLLPFTLGQETPTNWRSEAHFEYDFRDPTDHRAEEALGLTLHQCAMTVLRGRRYKYVHFAALPPLLFDLQNDPGEFVNLADKSTHSPIVLEAAQKLLSWRLTYEDQTLTHLKVTEHGVKGRPRARA